MRIEYKSYHFSNTDSYKEFNQFFDEIKLFDHSERFKLSSIFSQIRDDFTIISEYPYVDRNFRDSFYNFHSKKFINQKRNCVRLSIFSGKVDAESLSSMSEEEKSRLNDNFIGFSVIQKIYDGLVGTTVINPNYLHNVSGYMYLAKFKCTIYGIELDAVGFLHSSQNSETVTCAELTVLNIVNTLARSSHAYRSILPSDIAFSISQTSHERVLPTKGLPYESVSLLLNKYTGSSRLYFLDDKNYETLESSQKEKLRMLFHIYSESGFPLAVAIKGTNKQKSDVYHSIICIGHGKRTFNWGSKTENRETENNISFINSYKCYDKYVLIDDNQPVYAIQSFDKLGIYDDTHVVGFAVPLPKSAFLEADAAYYIAKSALFSFEDTRLDINYLKKHCKYSKKNPLILRLFLTSSSEYKKYRGSTIKSNILKEYYLSLDLPHYIWVMEISTAELYSDNLAIGDIIIDATFANTNHGIESIISIHYCDRIGYANISDCDNCESNDSKNDNDESGSNDEDKTPRKRWGDFNVYNDIDEQFPLYISNNLRSVNGNGKEH